MSPQRLKGPGAHRTLYITNAQKQYQHCFKQLGPYHLQGASSKLNDCKLLILNMITDIQSYSRVSWSTGNPNKHLIITKNTANQKILDLMVVLCQFTSIYLCLRPFEAFLENPGCLRMTDFADRETSKTPKSPKPWLPLPFNYSIRVKAKNSTNYR